MRGTGVASTLRAPEEGRCRPGWVGGGPGVGALGVRDPSGCGRPGLPGRRLLRDGDLGRGGLRRRRRGGRGPREPQLRAGLSLHQTMSSLTKEIASSSSLYPQCLEQFLVHKSR